MGTIQSLIKIHESVDARVTSSGTSTSGVALDQKNTSSLSPDQALLALSAERGQFTNEDASGTTRKKAEFKNISQPNFNRSWFPSSTQHPEESTTPKTGKGLDSSQASNENRNALKELCHDRVGRQIECSWPVE